MSKLSDNELLTLVKESFEEQKQIKILSIYKKDNEIHGVYVLPPEQSLSFYQEPLLDMITDIDEHIIIMEELGQLLLKSYNFGGIDAFLKLTHVSDINIASKLFDNLLSKCVSNPPLQSIGISLANWCAMTEDANPTRTHTFIRLIKAYQQFDDLDVDLELSNRDDEYILRQFREADKQLRQKKHKKITELVIHEINQLYIQLQIDLYMTDDK